VGIVDQRGTTFQALPTKDGIGPGQGMLTVGLTLCGLAGPTIDRG